MRCGRVDGLLEAYAAGELSPSRAEAVRLHLAACPACRRRAGLAQMVDRAVSANEMAEVPAGALGDLHERIGREAAALREKYRRRRRLRTRLAWQTAAGVAVVLSLLDVTGAVDVSGRAMAVVGWTLRPIALLSAWVAAALRERVPSLGDVPVATVSAAVQVAVVLAALFFVAAAADSFLASRTRRKFFRASR